MKIFDLFCGTGGFSKGFENSQNGVFDVVLGLDLLETSINTFKLNHPHAFSIVSDIRKYSKKDIAEMTKLKKGELDVLIGGPPCQGFSSIRPFRSSNDDDPRNSLFEEYASYINFFRPKFFVLENVIGLATHKNGDTLNIMQECFFSLGYETDWRILNAAHFGIPQKRERFIMFGAPKGVNFTFPEPTHFYNGSTISYKDKSKVITSKKNKVLPIALSTMDAISDLPFLSSGESANSYILEPCNSYQVARRADCSGLTLHTATKHSDKMMEIIKYSGKNINCIPKHLITSGFSSCYSRLDKNEPSVTITVNFVHPASNRCIHPIQNRALTPREGARLQSFDDNFKFFGNRSQITKQIGNAVPPLLGTAIADTISKYL